MKRLIALPMAFLVAVLPSCADTFPLPAEFDAAFATGQICAPASVATGGANTEYPVRFDLCAYRCINVDRASASVLTAFQCFAGVCQMVMLAHARVLRDDTQEGCDARNLENPPPGECTTERFDFRLSLPQLGDPPTPATGLFTVNIPYLNLDQGQELVDRLELMQEPPLAIIEDVVGLQTYPQRQFPLTFDTAAAPRTHADLTDADCHAITAP